jgi:hypothetical protein
MVSTGIFELFVCALNSVINGLPQALFCLKEVTCKATAPKNMV